MISKKSLILSLTLLNEAWRLGSEMLANDISMNKADKESLQKEVDSIIDAMSEVRAEICPESKNVINSNI